MLKHRCASSFDHYFVIATYSTLHDWLELFCLNDELIVRVFDFGFGIALDLTALFEVTVLDRDKVYYKFKWAVEKYIKEGPLKDCWLTTMVSAPMPLGSSV